MNDNNNGNAGAGAPVPGNAPLKQKHIVRDNKNTNSVLKKHSVGKIKKFFKGKQKIKGDGKLLGVPFHKILGVLEIYKRINDELLSSNNPNFVNYYTDNSDRYNRHNMKK